MTCAMSTIWRLETMKPPPTLSSHCRCIDTGSIITQAPITPSWYAWTQSCSMHKWTKTTSGYGSNPLAGLNQMGSEIDPTRNNDRSEPEREISTDESTVRVFVVPTDEESEIARQTLEVLFA